MKALFFALFLFPLFAQADLSVPRSKQYAWSVYDVSVLGGSSTSHPLGLTLPGGAVVTDVWVYINTVFAASGTESLALQCAGTTDLMAYNSVKNLAVNNMLGGRLAGTASANSAVIGSNGGGNAVALVGFGSIPSDCSVSAIVRGDSGYTPYTAGKATFIIEYFRQ